MSAGGGFPFAVKVCGVQSPSEVELCARAGATHVGINPWPHSPRRVTPNQARSLTLLSRRLGLVPVLLHLPGSPLSERDLLSLAPAVVQWYGPLPEVLFRRLLGGGLALWEARKSGVDWAPPRRGAVLLLDGPGPGAGGTGRPWEWRVRQGTAFPFLLAGGLGPQNVGEAVEACSPSGVDAASGLESAPGRKDPGRVRAFCAAAREALRRRGGPPLPAPWGGAP